MNKDIECKLEKFPTVPPRLVVAGASTARRTISVRMEDLCHHMFIDQHGRVPVSTNWLLDHYESLVTTERHLRFVDGGLGTDTESRRYHSWLFGRAFCRWFLAEHLDYAHFTHISTIMGKSIPAAHSSVTVERRKKGDTPDFVCADSKGGVCLGEAKGTQNLRVDFDERSKKWEKQFERVRILDGAGQQRRLKGYISAVQLVSAKASKCLPELWVKDPESPGDEPLSADEAPGLARLTMLGHYAGVMNLIGVPELAAGLIGESVDPQQRIGVLAFSLPNGLMPDRRFVIRDPWVLPFWPPQPYSTWFNIATGRVEQLAPWVLALDIDTAKRLAEVARGRRRLENMPLLRSETLTEVPEGLSVHRDGTVFGRSLELLRSAEFTPEEI